MARRRGACHERRVVGAAERRLRKRAPGMEPAAGREVDRARRVAEDAGRLGGAARHQARDGLHEPACRDDGDRRTARSVGGLHDPPEVHHRDAVARRDERLRGCGRSAAASGPSCSRSSASRFRTVACTETSSAETGSSATSSSGSRASARAIADALALAARELARVGVQCAGREPDEVEQLATAVARRGREGRCRAPEQLARASAAPSSAGSATSTDPGRPSGSGAGRHAPGRLVSMPAAEADLAGGRLVEPDDAAAERRLATTRLADQAKRSRREEIEVDAVDGAQDDGARRRTRRPTPPPRRGSATARPRTASSGSATRRSPAARRDVGGAHVVVDTRGATGRAPIGRSGNAPAMQSSRTRAHRGWNAATRRVARRGPADCPGSVSERPRARSKSGTRAEQAERVRVVRLREDRRRPSRLDDLARVHHGDAIAGLRDDREVVRDEDERSRRGSPGARRAASGSDPGSSRRARSSARRRAGAAGRPTSAIAIITRCRRPPESSCG